MDPKFILAWIEAFRLQSQHRELVRLAEKFGYNLVPKE